MEDINAAEILQQNRETELLHHALGRLMKLESLFKVLKYYYKSSDENTLDKVFKEKYESFEKLFNQYYDYISYLNASEYELILSLLEDKKNIEEILNILESGYKKNM